MGRTAAEIASSAAYATLYRQGQLAPAQAVERAACGCDYGGTSWATRAEADMIAEALDLAPGVALLEIGAGSGWPALYMAGRSGCDVTLVDLPAEALQIALARAARDRLPGTCRAVVADAAALPFADASFDAVDHADVLCCLLAKRAVLAECRRVLRPGGRMAFSVIWIAHGLSPAEHAAAAETAPQFAPTDTPYPALLAATGWTVLQHRDLTDAFAATCLAKVRAEEARQDQLSHLGDAAAFAARQARMRRRIAALECRHLRRSLFLAAPG